MGGDVRTGRFAVADGASTSARSEMWSQLLVDAYVQGSNPFAADVLAQLRRRWRELVMSPDLPWFALRKIEEGSAAAFLGVTIDPDQRAFHAIMVGDCCLFHIRRGQLLSASPLDRSDQFSRFPELLSSRSGDDPKEPVERIGQLRDEDVLVLATDAMAKSLLRVFETHQRILPLDMMTRSRDDFSRKVASYRQRGYLDNDDVTLCVVWA
ncbi:MAG TPA: hypothetical protein VFX16_17740 [Pseudonocardiaceae bacterium]|nr:hypothetical protein [Pseudonocardiaceae bacterium]